jgi:MFS family permease
MHSITDPSVAPLAAAPRLPAASAARAMWGATLTAAALLMVTMGTRQSMGLFVSPLNSATGQGIAAISFAMAAGQLVWGIAQPVAGACADRWGPGRVLAAGIVALALGMAITPLMTSSAGLVLALGGLAAAGSGAGSFSVLIAATAGRVAADKRGLASGVINAGGSFGQFVFSPLAQWLIRAIGWMGALWTLAAITLAALPLAAALRRAPSRDGSAFPGTVDAAHAPGSTAIARGGLGAAVRSALVDRDYLLLHAGFFTCGFHIAFLVTHLPGEVSLCGLPTSVASWSLALIGLANIAGSVLAGAWVQRVPSKQILAALYASRALLVLVYLAAPRIPATFYLFAIGLGFTWLATVPPTAAIVGKLFGVRYLATLFGLALLSHQVGGFFGAWLGGIALTQQGNYQAMWIADIALAMLAAFLNLAIREPRSGASAPARA